MAKTGFFNKPQAQQEPKKASELNAIAIGGEQFHAVAVSFLDAFKRSTRVNENTLKKILERLFTYYPRFISDQPYLTPHDRLQMVINNTRKNELVNCLAKVLRELAVDEICAHPTQYREVFESLDPKTPKSYLYEENTDLPPSALDALSRALGLNVHLFFVEHGKELRKRVTFNHHSGNSSRTELILQVLGNQYFPYVKFESDYAYVGQLAVSPLKATESSITQTGSLAGIIEEITEDNNRLRLAFEQNRKRLLSMSDAGELTKKQLIDLYIEFLPQDNNSYTNNMEFFYHLEGADRKPLVNVSPKESDAAINRLLVNRLAAWMSTKLIDGDELFDRLEGKPSASLGG